MTRSSPERNLNPKVPKTLPDGLLTFTEAARELNSTRFRIWYCIRSGRYRPKHFYGQTYFVEVGDDLEDLRAALADVGVGHVKGTPGIRGKYLKEG